MLPPVSVQAHHRHYRSKDVEVDAACLSVSNIRDVAVWIALHGGSVAGMAYRDIGPIEQRGIRLGTLEGGEIVLGVGDYVVRDHHGGFFRADKDEFHRMFDLTLAPVEVEITVTEKAR